MIKWIDDMSLKVILDRLNRLKIMEKNVNQMEIMIY